MSNNSFSIETPEGKTFRVLKTPCGVSLPYYAVDGGTHPPITNYTAIWDTGATNTVISQNVIDQLGLTPVSKARSFHANGESIVDVFYVNILLPNNMGCNYVKVTQGILSGMDVLIGMDIIGRGDFTITRKNNKSTFSFSIPQAPTTISVNLPNQAQTSTGTNPTLRKVGRNDPCPCNSGKKYKHCHGDT